MLFHNRYLGAVFRFTKYIKLMLLIWKVSRLNTKEGKSICFVHTECVLSVSLVSNTDFKACYKGCNRIEENFRRTWNYREPTEWQGQGILLASESIFQEEKDKNDWKSSLPPAISTIGWKIPENTQKKDKLQCCKGGLKRCKLGQELVGAFKMPK